MKLRLPRFAQSIRFRLTVLYSLLLFALAGAGLAVTYVAVDRATRPQADHRAVEGALREERAGGRHRDRGARSTRSSRRSTSARCRPCATTRSSRSAGCSWPASASAGCCPAGRCGRSARSPAPPGRSRRPTCPGGSAWRARTTSCATSATPSTPCWTGWTTRSARSASSSTTPRTSCAARSPIIRANLDASLIDSPDATPAERDRAVAVIDRATTRMSRLVEDLLATARRDADALADTDVDLSAVAREAGEEFGAVAAARQVFLTYELRHRPDADRRPDALRRAAGNLLSNAVRLSPDGGAVTVVHRSARRLAVARRRRPGAGHLGRGPGAGVRPVLARRGTARGNAVPGSGSRSSGRSPSRTAARWRCSRRPAWAARSCCGCRPPTAPTTPRRRRLRRWASVRAPRRGRCRGRPRGRAGSPRASVR